MPDSGAITRAPGVGLIALSPITLSDDVAAPGCPVTAWTDTNPPFALLLPSLHMGNSDKRHYHNSLLLCNLTSESDGAALEEAGK